MMNICIVAGARPNFVKVAPLIRAINNHADASYELIYTGRRDDATLEASIFDDLQMPRPQVYFGIDSVKLNEITSRVMEKFDNYLECNHADVVIVVDDLASTMAAAITAKRRGIRVAHLVAGTRSFDMNMPKEVNRLVIDTLSDYLFTAGVKSNSVATREQGDAVENAGRKGGTYMVGNILMDTLRHNRQRLSKPNLDIEDGKYIVFTINRNALLSDETKLRQLMDAMAEAAGDTPIIAPLRNRALEVIATLPSPLTLIRSLSYLEFGWLTAHARGIITDSGNVAEEATFNGVPCITLNSYTEHQETVTVGSNILVGEDPQRLKEETERIVRGEWKKCALPERWDGRTAERIVSILLQ